MIDRICAELASARACVRAGLLGADPPHRLAAIALAANRFGPVGGIIRIAALRHGTRPGLIDERGTLTFAELDRRSNAVANGWRAQGLRAHHTVGILARNHRGLLDAAFAAAKCGARIVMLNTDFANPQIREVAAREGIDLLVHDDEYTDTATDIAFAFGTWRAWADDAESDRLDALIDGGDTRLPPRPAAHSKIVILTSGTTGTPKGATRSDPRSLTPFGGLFGKVPFRGREATECCVPMFHALGFAHAMLAVGLGSTLVVRRKFDAVATLESVATHRVTAMIVAPVMLARLLDADATPRAHRDLSALRIIFVAGSQLGSALCIRATRGFGPVLYNLYGSTEVNYATIATPDELAAEPGCVGSVVRSATVRIIGEDGREQPTGSVGRIFVGNGFRFQGYTGGGTKDSIDGLVASGDVGHFDERGLLFIDGRDDDMIVSGGENVFPGEVEDVLASHAHVREAAVIGVPDDEYGQRLRAFVALRAGVELAEQDVKDFVRANLARFKVPRDVVFVDALPRNPTGKVLKRSLPTP
ncbi:AMP-binding protein [Candidatus Mycobacterium wuenschmannii]|uniref:AMP-binding protein n=1 Tax=Candidatus Mycobacterium wuenschmannii TaxID=3027808 RepID=A0ABY8VX97_9MYCO|nr:AMP-binding protein [Candidatus Mycobacterium wuenschmannii]WIM86782.1 AMP-binding protein [Candidatus Mycobacterium wuenschmannii]